MMKDKNALKLARWLMQTQRDKQQHQDERNAKDIGSNRPHRNKD